MSLDEIKATEKDLGGSQQVNAADEVAYNADGLLVERKDTHRLFKPRHVQLIAIGGAIGTGLFIGSGSALKRAGPLGLILGYLIYGGLVLGSFNAMGEMVSYLPIDGTYLRFSARFVDPSYGFAMSWFASYNNAITVAAEATAVASLINYWNDTISNGVWCALFTVSNASGTRYLGESEFWFSSLKVLLILGLFLFTIITMSGGNPTGIAYGFSNWKTGAMKAYIAEGSLGQFLGFWSVFIQAAFAFGGPDFLAMTAGEAKYPRRVMPNVFRRVIYRLLFFYIGGVTCVGILVSANDPDLGTSKKGAGASPFVLAAVRMGIPALPSIINALILTSAWSCGIALSFTASRNIYASALNGHAPKFFLKVWRGVPINCVFAVVAVSCLSFLSLSDQSIVVFTWLTNLLGGLWILNLMLQHIIYLRFRAGLSAQGIDRSSLPFYRRGQLWVSRFSVGAYLIIFLTSGFTLFVKGGWSFRDFIFSYITLPAFLAFYIGHKLYYVFVKKGPWRLISPDEMDFATGRAEVEEDEKNYPIIGNSKADRFQYWLWG